jgi:hypothetical protein
MSLSGVVERTNNGERSLIDTGDWEVADGEMDEERE